MIQGRLGPTGQQQAFNMSSCQITASHEHPGAASCSTQKFTGADSFPGEPPRRPPIKRDSFPPLLAAHSRESRDVVVVRAPWAQPASGPNQVFKIFCKANESYCLTVRDDGNVVLAPANAKDVYQVALLAADLSIY
jgi:hypothetical protein